MDGSSSQSARNRIKNIKFSLGKGNRSDGKLVVVGKHELTDAASAASPGTLRIKDKQNAPTFIRDILLSDDFLSATPPKVIISVTGAAADFPIDPKIEAVFCKGLVNAAKSTTAWIVSGGTDVGVMKLVGEANRLFADDVTTIGFATYNKLNNKHLLKPAEATVEYDGTAVVAPGSVNLNSNHSHFVLVESPVDAFGEEIEARSDFEEYMCTTYQLPLCLIVVNGGPGTLRTVAEGCNRQFSVVIFEGTGRAADAIAREVRRKRGLPYEHLEPMKLNNEQLAFMNDIVTNSNYLTLYSAEKGPFDFEILKSILSSAHGSLLKKLLLAIQWDRRDLAEHVLEEAQHEKLSTEEFGGILTKALEYALDQEKPELFRLFAEKGAKKTDLNLSLLYTTEIDKGVYILDPMITRYAPHLPTHRNFRTAHPKTRSIKISDKGPLLESDGAILKEPVIESRCNIDEARFIRAIFEELGFGHYAKLIKLKLKVQAAPKHKGLSSVSSNSEITLSPIDPKKDLDAETAADLAKVKFTDAMLWAILSGKLELAKVIWEYTSLPIHSALIAAGACKGVSNWLLNESEAFNETAEYFEKCATELLESMDFDGAIQLFAFDWPEFGKNTLQLAVDNECKDFMSNSHVQRHLDGLLYSDDKGTIPPGTSAVSVIFNIFFPFFLYPTKTYEVNPDAAESRRARWYYFYGLPYTKFWTSTLCYIGYLILLVFVLAGAQDNNIDPIEILLWIWMAAIALEEVSQCMEEGWAYFKYTSNRMDIFILLLNIVYFSLALAAYGTGSTAIQLASTDILIVTTIISYIRLMDVFSISKELGPLYIVLIKIVGDVFKWVFVFILFAIGFQVSFMALQNQIDTPPGGGSGSNSTSGSGSGSGSSEPEINMWTPAIAENPGSFMSAYYIIIGDWGTPMAALGSGGFAAVVVSIYALISQIMLVNLLIAMMGDTFNNVKENSDKEWRFSRYNLIEEYTSASFHPPPFNIVVVPIKKLLRCCIRCCSDKVPIDNDPSSRQSTRKQRDQFKNLMRDTKDDFLDEQKKASERTIESVSDTIRDSFKQILDESEMKHKSIELKLTEIVKKTESITVSAGGAGASASVQKAETDIKMEMNYVQENVKTAVKTELAQLQTSLLAALKGNTTETTTMTLQGKQVPVTWNTGTGITQEVVQRIIKEWRPFVLWQENMNKPEAVENTIVSSITIQAVDLFGPRIGFVKFMANVASSTGSRVPGIVFMRGGAVGMLTILKLSDEGSPDHNKEYTILTIQPRVPIGQTRFAEIPAVKGMIDGGRFAGAAAKEMKEETGIDIQEDQLIDLTSLAYQGNHVGMYPSAGGCDEVIRLYLFRTIVTREQLNGYQNKLTGVIDEGEVISLKVVPLPDLWLHAPDAKALSALYLYEKLMQTGVIPTNY